MKSCHTVPYSSGESLLNVRVTKVVEEELSEVVDEVG